MSLYHFLEDSDIYIQLSSGNVEKLAVTPEGLSISQTFTETTFDKKTIQNQNKFIKEGTIKRAQPATFSFTVPFIGSSTNNLGSLFSLATDVDSSNNLSSFNLFIVNVNKYFTIETCVITSMSFNINNESALSATFNGVGSKLMAVKSNHEFNMNSVYEPGFTGISQEGALSFDINKLSYPFNVGSNFLILSEVQVEYADSYNTAGGAGKESLTSTSMELQNQVSWVGNRTVKDSINTTDASNVIYPTNYVLKDRSLSGNAVFAIPTYPDSDQNFTNEYSSGLNQKFKENQDLTVVARSVRGTSSGKGIKFSGKVNYTSRVALGAFYTMSLDWRLASNNSAISSVLSIT